MKVILASNNKGKIAEMKEILSPLGYEVISQSEAGFNFSAEETGTTFEENAKIKAKAIYNVCKTAVISDDSGIEVDALDKRPGVYSARYGGENLSDEKKCQMLLDELQDVPEEKRIARFVCVIYYIDQNGKETFFREECEGKISFEAKGKNGFGFDPVFFVDKKSFAEIPAEKKNKISHRAKALQKLTMYLKK